MFNRNHLKVAPVIPETDGQRRRYDDADGGARSGVLSWSAAPAKGGNLPPDVTVVTSNPSRLNSLVGLAGLYG